MLTKIINRLKFRKIKPKFAAFGKNSGFQSPYYINYADVISIGTNVSISQGLKINIVKSHYNFNYTPKLIIGDNLKAHDNFVINCSNKIEIGNDVLIASDVFIIDHNHGMDPTVKTGYSYQRLISSPIYIKDGCWIGQKVTVLPGVTIGEHSIIGSNSVVSKNIPPYCIAVGSPARVVKQWSFDMNKWVNIKANKS